MNDKINQGCMNPTQQVKAGDVSVEVREHSQEDRFVSQVYLHPKYHPWYLKVGCLASLGVTNPNQSPPFIIKTYIPFPGPLDFPKELRFLGYCVFQKVPIVKGPLVKGLIVYHVFKTHSNNPKFIEILD